MSERWELLHGLRAHLRRAAGRGLRKVPAAPEAPSGAPGGRSGPSMASAPRATSPPRSDAPPPAPGARAPGGPAAPARPAPPPAGVPAPPAAPPRGVPEPVQELPRVARAPEAAPAPVGRSNRGLFQFGGEGELAGRAAALRAEAARAGDLESLREAVAGCRACNLCETRTQTVFMDGRGTRRVMFVGEAPGFHEDRLGIPFVGAAGQLLTDIVQKGMGIRREEVSIANVLKCRPPGNRDPLPEEKALCTAWLDRQIELVDPEVLVGLGRHAAGHLLGEEAPLGRLRGKVHERAGRRIVATYHPAYLLRNPADKRAAWQDIQQVMGLLGLPLPGSGRGA